MLVLVLVSYQFSCPWGPRITPLPYGISPPFPLNCTRKQEFIGNVPFPINCTRKQESAYGLPILQIYLQIYMREIPWLSSGQNSISIDGGMSSVPGWGTRISQAVWLAPPPQYFLYEVGRDGWVSEFTSRQAEGLNDQDSREGKENSVYLSGLDHPHWHNAITERRDFQWPCYLGHRHAYKFKYHIHCILHWLSLKLALQEAMRHGIN